MLTTHQSRFTSSAHMRAQSAESIDLVVTSPPYPMIAMWDAMFALQNPAVVTALEEADGSAAFEQMHQVLDRTWAEVWRVLKPGGFACINIGDATRTIDGNFALYPNHVRLTARMRDLGFTVLPCILWRKQTNAPNKFMGSGMLPAGAYVTLEHEYILIFRKGSKRVFATEADKARRRASAIFWEERNAWYSDVWFDIKGAPQALRDVHDRQRSAAYPFDVVYRLINMYSVKADTVLDPFWGTGTTTFAAITAGRNSIGYEIDGVLEKVIDRNQETIIELSSQALHDRLTRHIEFVRQRLQSGGRFKYSNAHYGFPVITAQEKELLLNPPCAIKKIGPNTFEASYDDRPRAEFRKCWEEKL